MSQPDQRTDEHVPEEAPSKGPLRRDVKWLGGLVAGLAGGVAMGLIMQFAMGVMDLVGLVVGVESALVGWGLHLAISAVYGLIFAWTVSLPFIRDEFITSFGGSVGAGVVYGGLLIVVSGGVVTTLIAEAAGVTDQPFEFFQLPGTGEAIWLTVWGGVAHLLYGLVVGAVYAMWHGPGIGWPSPAEH